MKKFAALFLFFVALFLISCGGGGGGGGGGTNNTGGPAGNFDFVQLEAVLANNPGRTIDALNIQVGETVQFRVAGYENGTRTVLNAGTFTTNDTTNVVGTLTPDGLFTATGASSQNFTVSTTAQGDSFTKNYSVRPAQALLIGVARDTNGRPVVNATVLIVNNANTVVAGGRTLEDGFFRISTPTTGKRLNFNPSTLPTAKYYRSFVVNGSRYTSLDQGCSAPIPALANGGTSNVGTIVVDAARNLGGGINVPPPPPDGCP